MSATPSERYSMLLVRFLNAGQWERALGVARDWLSQDPESAQAQIAAGQCLVNLQQPAQARPHLEKALTLVPRSGFVHRLLAIAEFQQGRHGPAEEHIQQALALQPMDYANWYQLAYMRYRQNAPTVAAQHARRALELAPQDADTLNLLALCEDATPALQLARFQHALSLDPENANLHNNLGRYYLGPGNDRARAEECFRHALMLNPRSKASQQNLFAALRQRDPVYRVLVAPRDLAVGFWGRARGRGVLGRIGFVALWLVCGRYVLAIGLCWLGLVYPLVKVYEHLTLGDIQAKAGVAGARRGGFLGTRRWPFAVRFGLFAALAVLFWGGLYALFVTGALPSNVAFALLGIGFLIFLVVRLAIILRRWWREGVVARRERQFRRRQNDPGRTKARPPAVAPVLDQEDY